MSDAQGTIQSVFSVVSMVFVRLSRQLAPNSAPNFFAELGIPLSPAAATSLAGSLRSIDRRPRKISPHIGTDLEAAVDAGDAATVIEKTASALTELATVITSFKQLAEAVSGLSLPGVTPADHRRPPGQDHQSADR